MATATATTTATLTQARSQASRHAAVGHEAAGACAVGATATDRPKAPGRNPADSSPGLGGLAGLGCPLGRAEGGGGVVLGSGSGTSGSVIGMSTARSVATAGAAAAAAASEPEAAAEGATADQRHRLTVLNFNVFAGSPLPFFQNYTSTASLEDSQRLRLQIDKIRALAPDIICLQEMCSDGVERYYREALADLYEAFCDSHPPPLLGLTLLYGLYALLAGILSLAMHLSAEVVGLWSPSLAATAPAPALSLSLWWWWGRDVAAGDPRGVLVFVALALKCFVLVVLLMRKSCLAGFLGGSVKASTVLLWRRDRFTTTATKKTTAASKQQQQQEEEAAKDAEGERGDMFTTLFQEQQGDWLNLFRPRGYLTARLFFRGMPLWVVNTHCNLGHRAYRRRQIEELRDHCRRLGESGSVLLCGDFNATPDSEEMLALCDGAGLTDALSEKGCQDPSWRAENPLTHGVLIEDDHRCDFILYKALQGKHRLVNRVCRLDYPLWKGTWLSDHFGLLMELGFHPLTADP